MALSSQHSEARALALTLDWTAICQEIAGAIKTELKRFPTFAERKVEVGVGEGGDHTLVIDEAAEDAVFKVLERVCAETGAGLTAVSEERGIVEIGGGGVRVVIDPIDGSLNAKRVGMSFSLSIAVAAGDTIADVVFGYVYDFGGGEEWVARAGAGATVNGRVLDPTEPGNGLEVVGLESTKPAFLTPTFVEALAPDVARLRSIGSIALTLCQVAAARFDGMCSLRHCRSVDAAAGQLIVREAGGHVIFGDATTPLAAPLDLAPYKQIVAARDESRARFLLEALGRA